MKTLFTTPKFNIGDEVYYISSTSVFSHSTRVDIAKGRITGLSVSMETETSIIDTEYDIDGLIHRGCRVFYTQEEAMTKVFQLIQKT